MTFSTTPPQPDAGETFDYIITGAGCAGLSLLMRLLAAPGMGKKKILLVDKDAKKQNDRTWCFWEETPGFFEPVVYRRWDTLWFHSATLSRQLHLAPYQYKLIRGIDFYNHCFNQVRAHDNVTFLEAEVTDVFSTQAGTGIVANGKRYAATYIFNSLLFKTPILSKNKFWLLQHFTGWVINTPQPAFKEAEGTLMDFRTDQKEGATFFYVLPFSPTKALVEYTLFSKTLLPKEAYQRSLKKYIEEQLGIKDYAVEEREFGVIPMTNCSFTAVDNNIINIGTAGGQTKSSSGYTFQAIQWHSHALVNSLQAHGHPFAVKKHSRRFHFYDSVLLHILNHRILPGDLIFTDLFKNNAPGQVFRFLDNSTSLPQELSIISSLPTLPFLKAAIKQLTGI